MKSVANVVVILMLLVGLSATPSLAVPAHQTAAKPATSITIGEFAVAVAKAMDDAPETRATPSPEAALKTLKESGLGFKAGSEAVLTQAELAAFLRESGVQVSVPSPNQPVSPEQAKAAISGFGSLFASRSEKIVVPPTVNSRNISPEDFADCAALERVPDCKACCEALGMTQQTCGRACGQANAGHVSATEPTP
ncbi:MAG TPA: hypothetical protein VFW45_07785 [Candidatus Polarisedimenticolia bacterium]|nr:hypothetical protein [Candidatus Polarisedimenticolia bacterium]